MNINKAARLAGDEYWIEQYRLGNPESVGVLYQRYYQKVYHRCLSLCKDPDEAFDLAQDALLKAFDHLPAFKGKSSFSTWLYTITFNHCREFFRKSKRLYVCRLDEHYEESGETDCEAFTEDTPAQDQAESTMLDLLNTISETEKRMLFLKYHDGESIENLQVMFSLSESAVKMRLKRAKEKLNTRYARAVA